MEVIPDNILLKKVKNEDSSSFELLYKYYFPSISNYVKQNQGSSEDAEDIFQETVIVLLHKVRKSDLVLTSSLKTYIYAISKNLWLKRLRDNKLIIVGDELSLKAHKTETHNFELLEEKSNEQKVENWLQKITRNCQNILKALFFYEEPMDSLMTKMGWKNKHTASNQKHKCIQQIKNLKEKEA